MLRKSLLISVALALAALAWAGDPWKEKPYDQWDEDDCRKVLGDSPWAQRVTVTASWMRSTQPGDQAGGGRPGGMPGGASAPIEGGPPAGTEVPTPSVAQPQAQFTVRWASSATVRQAIVRGAILRGAIPPDKAAEALGQPAHEYQVMVLGRDMSPFRRIDDMELRSNTYLRPKKSKAKIAPSRVEIRRSEDGRQIASILFWFPKQVATGEPVLARDEKGVEFVCSAGLVSFRVSFNLTKMLAREGLDL